MKRITAIGIFTGLVLLNSSGVFAAPYDIQGIDDVSEKYSFGTFRRTPSIVKKISINPSKYTLESKSGDKYLVSEVDANLKAGAKDFDEAIKNLTPIEDKNEEEFKVIDIR